MLGFFVLFPSWSVFDSVLSVISFSPNPGLISYRKICNPSESKGPTTRPMWRSYTPKPEKNVAPGVYYIGSLYFSLRPKVWTET